MYPLTCILGLEQTFFHILEPQLHNSNNMTCGLSRLHSQTLLQFILISSVSLFHHQKSWRKETSFYAWLLVRVLRKFFISRPCFVEVFHLCIALLLLFVPLHRKSLLSRIPCVTSIHRPVYRKDGLVRETQDQRRHVFLSKAKDRRSLKDNQESRQSLECNVKRSSRTLTREEKDSPLLVCISDQFICLFSVKERQHLEEALIRKVSVTEGSLILIVVLSPPEVFFSSSLKMKIRWKRKGELHAVLQLFLSPYKSLALIVVVRQRSCRSYSARDRGKGCARVFCHLKCTDEIQK